MKKILHISNFEEAEEIEEERAINFAQVEIKKSQLQVRVSPRISFKHGASRRDAIFNHRPLLREPTCGANSRQRVLDREHDEAVSRT